MKGYGLATAFFVVLGLPSVACADPAAGAQVLQAQAAAQTQTVTPAAALDKSGGGAAGEKAEAGDDDDEKDDKFPQPVRVGDLIGRAVIAPVESQNLLGHVRKLVRDKDGDLQLVMTYGGYLGFGSRLVCVSVDDVALTGYAIQATEISGKDLDALPTCSGAGETPLDQNAIIKVNLAKPAH